MPLTYIQWNDLIARYFFNEGMAGKEVILFANIDLINEIGRSYGEGFDNFVQKSIEGPESIYIRSDNICHKAYSTYLLGRRKRFAYPPYIGYLALFVCAATREGDYEINSYYPRLKDIVEDNTDTNMSACFTKIDQLWDDLQQWSQVEKGDMLGKFRKTRRGNLAHVGLIYAQTVMSEEERKKLPVIFSKANLDPTDPGWPGWLSSTGTGIVEINEGRNTDLDDLDLSTHKFRRGDVTFKDGAYYVCMIQGGTETPLDQWHVPPGADWYWYKLGN